MIFDKMIIFRDIGFYIFATVMTLVFALIGKITWYFALIYLLLYVALVLFVVISERLQKKNPTRKISIDSSERSGVIENLLNEDPKDADDNRANIEESGKKIKVVGGLDVGKLLTSYVLLNGLAAFIRTKIEMKKEHDAKDQESRSLADKIWFVIDWPFKMLIWLTSFPNETEKWSYAQCLMWPFTGTYFIFVVLNKSFYDFLIFGDKMSWSIAFYSMVAVLLLLFVVLLPKTGSAKWLMAFIIVDILIGLLYTTVFVGVLIDMLNTFGVLLNLEKTYLGLTILAVGNALPDAFATISLAQRGKGVMAVCGGYAGQLFGLLVGFGISMMKTTLTNGKDEEFELFKDINANLLDIIVLFVALGVLLFTFGFGIFNNFRMNKVFAIGCIAMYAAFFVAASWIAVNNAMKDY
jgi:sodium/potassium/calcium exchanger 6